MTTHGLGLETIPWCLSRGAHVSVSHRLPRVSTQRLCSLSQHNSAQYRLRNRPLDDAVYDGFLFTLLDSVSPLWLCPVNTCQIMTSPGGTSASLVLRACLLSVSGQFHGASAGHVPRTSETGASREGRFTPWTKGKIAALPSAGIPKGTVQSRRMYATQHDPPAKGGAIRAEALARPEETGFTTLYRHLPAIPASTQDGCALLRTFYGVRHHGAPPLGCQRHPRSCDTQGSAGCQPHPSPGARKSVR